MFEIPKKAEIRIETNSLFRFISFLQTLVLKNYQQNCMHVHHDAYMYMHLLVCHKILVFLQYFEVYIVQLV